MDKTTFQIYEPVEDETGFDKRGFSEFFTLKAIMLDISHILVCCSRFISRQPRQF